MSKISKGNKGCLAYRILIRGSVQGVGFRPLVYRLAQKHRIKGSVTNTGHGVTITAQGKPQDIKNFLKQIQSSLPHHASIKEISKNTIPISLLTGFSISPSKGKTKPSADVPPDLSICPDCLDELFDGSDRRHLYPFINCTNCGPRFTITKRVPYDRKNTTMSVFKMCTDCRKEYEDVSDRRFHAQPDACFVCGPEVRLLDRSGKMLAAKEKAIEKTIEFLKKGKIIAVKSLGGYHLACDALNNKAVNTLRKRKDRPHKPLAVMARDIETARKYALLRKAEENLITSAMRPIVLLIKKELVPDTIAPGNAYVGIMLPYTPLHYLLFSGLNSPLRMLVMTSGNRIDEPICSNEKDALSKLSGIADYFLVHDREIHNRCDDSIIFNFNGKEDGNVFVRRSRGYVPSPIEIVSMKNNGRENILATGPEMKNTFCLTREKNAYVSQYIGDMDNEESLVFYKEALSRFKKYLSVKPSVIAYDLHPDYMTSVLARELLKGNKNLKSRAIQHHEAHIASVMAENNITKPVIGFAFDGTGLGHDGKVWGGECFLFRKGEFYRFAHFENIALPGGDIAAKEIWRLGVSLLAKSGVKQIPAPYRDYPITKVRVMIEKKINSPESSSLGRVFDAVASILDIRQTVTFEAQAAIELEGLALDINVKKGYNFNVFYDEKEGCFIISLADAIKGILSDKARKLDVKQISAKFHFTIAEVMVSLAGKFRIKFGVNDIALSGGVFQNRVLMSLAIDKLKKAGFRVYWNRMVPPNDGGISLGQAFLSAKNSR